MSATPPAPAWWGGPNAAVRARRRAHRILALCAFLVAVGFCGLIRVRSLQDRAVPRLLLEDRAAAESSGRAGGVRHETYRVNLLRSILDEGRR